MAKRISQLDELTALTGDEIVPIVKNGRNYRIAASRLGGNVTKDSLGLGNVDNTPDALKPISNATQNALNNKANAVHVHQTSDVEGLDQALAQKANAAHGHAVGDISGLQTALDGKAAAAHGHDASSINGLDVLLTGKSDVGHTHTKDQIAGLDTDLSNLQTQVNQRSIVGHGHNAGEISGLSAFVQAIVDQSGGGGGTPASVVAGELAW